MSCHGRSLFIKHWHTHVLVSADIRYPSTATKASWRTLSSWRAAHVLKTCARLSDQDWTLELSTLLDGLRAIYKPGSRSGTQSSVSGRASVNLGWAWYADRYGHGREDAWRQLIPAQEIVVLAEHDTNLSLHICAQAPEPDRC